MYTADTRTAVQSKVLTSNRLCTPSAVQAFQGATHTECCPGFTQNECSHRTREVHTEPAFTQNEHSHRMQYKIYISIVEPLIIYEKIAKSSDRSREYSQQGPRAGNGPENLDMQMS